jgi:acetoin utilization deacetylase AcuC-like enzyme
VHQGNGNAVLFQNEARVFTFSIQCKGNYFSQKEKSDLDIELPIGCNDETYLGTLHHWLKRINAEAGKFDLIFYQAGVDIIEDDRLGRMNISGKGLHKRNEMIYNFALELGIPLVITMGGGYPRKDWEPILSAHTDVYVSAFERINDTVD